MALSRGWFSTHLGLVVGLGLTAASMSSGFIWATEGKVLQVYVAGFFAWTGYLVAHYAVAGVFVDDMSETDAGMNTTDETDDDRSLLGHVRGLAPADGGRAVGFVAGIAVLVAGIAILAWYVRQGNHLLGNVGSGMFLGGYVVAHYFDAGIYL